MDGRCIHHLRYSLQSVSGTISDLIIMTLVITILVPLLNAEFLRLTFSKRPADFLYLLDHLFPIISFPVRWLCQSGILCVKSNIFIDI